MSQALRGKMAVKARQVRPGQAFAAEVKAGELVQVTDVAGKQVADFVAFGLDDRAEVLSVGATRGSGGSMMLQTGMKLLSNRRNPMFALVEDTVGRHDMLFAACDPKRYKDDFGLDDHPNCREALTEALSPFGVGYDRIPDPVNLFMNVAIKQRGELEIREPISERNDFVVFEALMDCVIGVCACPQDQTATNGFNPTDILVRVYR
jgi:uncharacterized protein YcgI (DUF1989 family)